MIKRINHIGIAVHSIENSLSFYRDVLGLNYLGEEIVQSEQVKVAFFEVGESKIELLEALNEESPIARFIDKKGEGIHHLAFDCEDMHTTAKKQESYLIPPYVRDGAHHCWVSFIHPKYSSGVLIELTQKKT